MSVSEKASAAAFAYESSVHSTHLLLSLNDQRQRDLLCDVTVLVEDRRFRAHRAVLAACSDYFLARVVDQAQQRPDLIITLPEEVTVKGFKPLLQFAYTAKLTLTRANVDEVRRCVRFLGVHNIEESCFQFLRLKFLDSPADPPECPRPECPSPRCPRRAGPDPAAESDDGGGEDFPEKEPERAAEAEGSVRDSAGGEEDDGAPGPPSLCPKYRKFQKAFGTDRARPADPAAGEDRAPAGGTTPPRPAPGPETPGPADVPPPPPAKCQGTPPAPGAGEAAETEVGTPRCPPEELPSGSPFPPPAALDPHGLYSLSLMPVYDHYGDLAFAGAGGADPGPERAAEGPGEAGGRSSVEREVAEHLAKGFWSDVCGPDAAARPVRLSPAAGDGADQPPAPAQRRSECPWLGICISESPEPGPRTFATLSAVSCPFMSHLGADGCSDGGGGDDDGAAAEGARRAEAEEGAATAVACQYACEIGLGDESETDTEGDSESCSAREQECEVKLPFNAQRIISLSRNDFQSLLKMHRLTPEQLDCIHDIRRRSKNRIAAQRCRKRKLDCIQNLESEIEKLQSEKESLLKERDHILSTLGETKQNLTGLCQQVCKEAALSREQIQILAKYSASDCPLSFFISDRGEPPPAAAAAPAAAGEPERCCRGGGITDFCQQMTDKCTTDE
ncbi:transcription regulator protein BACH1 [Tachyglossus aculeatus]|uniref:transcription regulator protein BACH1 n=1 Tax=Tachyglossus aculeatus TaxID=9261 RepID=UPI0018F477B4|nr:transcription regulator protein BACH1 [Tachyglossus aculeatus]